MKVIALNIVKAAFANKVDKGGHPYIEHLQRVSENAHRFFKGVDQSHIDKIEILGLLHDLIEDCAEWNLEHIDAIFCNSDLTRSLNLLTKKKEQTYEDYIISIFNGCAYARAVKLADLEDNMNIARLKIVSQKDLERLKKYHSSYLYLLKK